MHNLIAMLISMVQRGKKTVRMSVKQRAKRQMGNTRETAEKSGRDKEREREKDTRRKTQCGAPAGGFHVEYGPGLKRGSTITSSALEFHYFVWHVYIYVGFCLLLH